MFTRSPQLERRNPQPSGPLTQNPPPAKSQSPLPGTPGPQVAQGAPHSSASSCSWAQLKLVSLALMGSARLESCRDDRLSKRGVCQEAVQGRGHSPGSINFRRFAVQREIPCTPQTVTLHSLEDCIPSLPRDICATHL